VVRSDLDETSLISVAGVDMSDQSFQAWAEAIGNQIIKSVKCGINGVCQSCGGVINRTKTDVFHFLGGDGVLITNVGLRAELHNNIVVRRDGVRSCGKRWRSKRRIIRQEIDPDRLLIS